MSLKKKTVTGIFWSFGSQIGRQTTQFIITAILAHLLLPSDFGLVSMVTVFTGFVTIFGEMGVTNALIQKQDTHDRHYYSAFWLNVFVGIGLTIVFYLLAPLVAFFYRKQELIPILRIISINFIISSFAIIQQSILIKAMEFKKLMIRDLIAVLLAGVLSIYLAFNGYGVWSLVVQIVAFTFLSSLLLWIFSEWRPRLYFNKTDIKDIWSFSANMAGANVINYVARNVDSLLIGKFLGAQALGYYSLAYKLMMIPVQNITWAIGKVVFPAFSKIQTDLEKVKSVYMQMIDYISLISFPIMLGIFAIAFEFVNVVYGSKWLSIASLIRIMCFCGMLQSVYLTVTNVTLSLGRADLHLRIGLVYMIGVIIAVSLGMHWGIMGVAAMYLAQQILWAIYVQRIINSLIRLNWRYSLKIILKNLLLAIVMLIIIGSVHIIPGLDRLMIICYSFIIGLSVYLALIYIFKQNLIKKSVSIFN